MNLLTIFLLEIVLCVSISITVFVLLKPLLHDVLMETCGTSKRAAFWVMFTRLMLIISPLLLVIFFAPVTPLSEIYMTLVLKDTLFRSLFGIFIALLIIGQVIWRSISKQNEFPATTNTKQE